MYIEIKYMYVFFKPKSDQSKELMLANVPLAIVDAAICWWISFIVNDLTIFISVFYVSHESQRKIHDFSYIDFFFFLLTVWFSNQTFYNPS